MGDPELDGNRDARWPFAERSVSETGAVIWTLEGRSYPRALLWSKILLRAREQAEAHAQAEISSMALVMGRSVSPGMRRDLQQAASLARIDTLWWVDRAVALAYDRVAQQRKALMRPAVPTPSDRPVADQAQDPLARIDEVLRVPSSTGPCDARLSMAEFSGPPVQASGAAQSKAAEGELVQAQDASKPELDPTQTEEDAVPASETAPGREQEESEKPDVQAQGEWIWVADGLGVELARVRFEPELSILSRDLVADAGELLWRDKIVESLCQELADEHGVALSNEGLAMVRLWDLAGKVMDRLSVDAQAELHLAHLCVHEGKSVHYQSAWARRRMDAMVAGPVGRLRELCQRNDDAAPWQWRRYGSGSEMPAWTRVAQQDPQLIRKDARVAPESGLVGACAWIEERQGRTKRTLVPDQMLGDLVWEHPSGLTLRCACDGASLPYKEDFELPCAELAADDQQPWTVSLCLPSGSGDEALRFLVTRVQVPGQDKDGRVRVEIQRQAKIVVSRTPAAKNAGAPELVHLQAQMSDDDVQAQRERQEKQDRHRFVCMRAEAMRKALGKHCAHLSKTIEERGAKMDDLLRTRLVEWVGKAQALLDPDRPAQREAELLTSLEPVYRGLVDMAQTLSAPQKKSLSLTLVPLPELIASPSSEETRAPA